MKKKILTVVVSVMLVAAMLFAGCGKDVSYIGTVDGEQIPVADYTTHMLSAFGKAQEMTECEMSVEAVLAQEIEGMPGDQWICEETMKNLRESIAVLKEFERQGLVLSAGAEEAVKENVDSQWKKYSESYSSNGITQLSLYKKNSITYMSQELFKVLYGEGGEKALSQEELAEFFDQDYMFFRMIAILKTDEKGEPLSDEELEEQLLKAQDYRKRLLAGEDPDTLVVIAEEEMVKVTGQELDHVHSSSMDSHITVLEKGSSMYSVEVTEGIENMRRGEVKIFRNDDEYFFVVQKLAAMDDTDILEENRMALSYMLCKDDFSEYIDSLAEKVEIVVNEDAMKLYDPELFVLE